MKTTIFKMAASAVVGAAAMATFAWAQGVDLSQGGQWTDSEIKKGIAEIAPLADKADNGTGAKPVIMMPAYKVFLAAKHKAYPELHDNDVDIFVIREGGGTLQVGGELVDKKVSGPGEATGSAIRGGKMYKAAPGDILYVPKNTPHMWLLSPGQTVHYIAMKVTEK